MRSPILLATSSLIVILALAPVSAQLVNEPDLAELCSTSPLNSRCTGYSREVALEKRPGEAGACVLIINGVNTETVCKLTITGQTIAAYYEFGDKVRAIDNEKATQEIQISPNNIKAIRYREAKKDNSTARVVNTIVFGLPGLFGTRDKKVSEIEIEYIPNSETTKTGSETSVVSADSPEATKNTLRIIVKRKTGEKLLTQLQELTGLKAEFLQAPR
ncbi:hypothetical protein ACE1CI_30485 [Aerosakkonemataceae cyanobacterium BLCC-F50]|uniref:Uncharacterized protein n=1 Tax=Floridaenema flaviceps BLCC-F50 TaxID=3153642 RepID=A0ABV4XZU8_9CYAN